MNRVLHYLQRGTNQSLSGDAPTDQQLLERYLQNRDQDAFADLVRRHELSVLKACRQVLRSAVDVDDAFQATFLVLIRRARQVRWQPSLRGWLVAVAHRISVRLAAQQRRSVAALKSHDFSYEAASPLTEVSWQEACGVLHEELNQMRDQFRLPLLLCYLQGYSRDEAAAQLGWSLGSVKAGLERGRQQLKARLERRGVTLSAGLFTMLASSQTTEAGALSPVTATLALLTGNVPTKVATLSRSTGWAGSLLASRLALVALILLIGTAAGVTWTKGPDEPLTAATASPVSIISAGDPENITITGTVLGPDRKPAGGATVTVSKTPIRTAHPTDTIVMPADPKVTTDDQGKFQIVLKTLPCRLIAQKPGFGLDFITVTADKAKQPLKLQLGEEMLLQGQVLDEAKQPVEGVTIGLESIRCYTASELEDALEKVRQTGDSNSLYRSDVEYLLVQWGSLVTARSDSAGKFTLRGLPVGALTQLTYSKPGLVSHSLMVALVPGFDKEGTPRHKLTTSTIDDALLKREGQNQNETIDQTRQRLRQMGYGRQIEGATLDIGMRKGVTLEGTVRNLNGQPVAGVLVLALGRVSAVSNQQGHYLLNDVQPSESYMVYTTANDRYLEARASAVHRNGGPIRIDLLVRPGAILRGKVIDGQTGKGVQSIVQVEPTPGNPLLNKQNVQHECSVTTEPDGTFQLIAPPGDIIVTASPALGTLQGGPMPYVPAKLLPSHSGVANSSRGGEDTVTFQNTGKSYHLRYAYQLLELPTEGETTVELTMTRGKERTLHLVDPQGKVVESATVSGLDQSARPLAITQGTAQVVGMTAAEKGRNVFIMDRIGKRGAMVYLSTSDTNPLTVRLQPLASLTIRVVDGSGKPRVDFPIAIQPVLGTDRQQPGGFARQSWQPDTLQLFFPTFQTDQGGKVTLTNILPNVEFRLYSVQPDGTLLQFTGSSPNKFTLQAGEQRNAGDFAVNDLRQRNFR